jgi:hypothetical protein
MSQRDSEFWTKARRARDKLIDRFIDHPDIMGVDIGYPPDWDGKPEEMVLRIHVRGSWMEAKPDQRVAFPEQVDGIPVIHMLGDYRLEADTRELDED